MAEACLQFMLDNLSSLIQQEIGLIMGVDDEMKKLSSTLTAIQAVLEDAEVKQWESKATRDWLAKLNDLTYEIDDVLDECASEVSRLEYKNPRSSRYSLKKILFRRKIGRRMKEVTGKLDMVAEERGKFHLREVDVERKSNYYAAARETGSILNEPQQVYGRDKEKEEVVDILVNQVSDNEQVSVLPVIGIGGLGKTTLARLVFNDEKVAEHFDSKIWVCVSDDFDLKTVIKGIIESATGSGSASDLRYLDALQRRLWELLNQKRYLLVLDDVWNDDQEKWDMLRNAITCGSRGSAVLVTTRLKMVAHIVGTLPAFWLAGLPQEDCWLLFKERAFGQEKEEHSNLVPIGEQIVKKCGGVPLAAKALGGLLRFKREKKEWIHVQDSEIWNLQPEETLLLPALRLSYHHLPLELRRCFAYCAVFPKDLYISKEELIFLWIAHGYISPNGILEEEDIGNRIWNELVLRSLFEDVKTYGGETMFTMHDLVHDLAQSVMENKVPGIRAQCNDTSAPKRKIRQVNLREHLVAFPSSIQPEIDSPASLMNLSGLRMLDASSTKIKEIPSTVSDLKHLRYLNLSLTDIRTLPSAICSLWNLKILNLNHCYYLVKLPKHMRLLRNLRHLLLEDCPLSEMPSKIGELSSLKTLNLFVVGHQKGNQLGELQFLNLGGKINILHLERVKNHMDAGKANLREKENLRELRLEWEGERTSKLLEELDEKILEALEPHPNIEAIGIDGFSGRYFPQWVRNPSLVNLVSFALENCPNCSTLPQLGELPHVKTMYLSDLVVEYIVEDQVENGDPVITKFPSLEELSLHYLPNLKGFAKEENIEMFPRLQKLDIRGCLSLILPPLPPLKELSVSESNNLTRLSKPDHLTSLKIDGGNIPNEVLENLTNLKSLMIYDARENTLSAQGLRGLKSLESLHICSETQTCLPPHGWCPHLTNLMNLGILDCPEFVELPEDIRNLKSLTQLSLTSLPKMVSLPEALKHIPSPYSLRLSYLPQLTELPACLRNFTSLRGLDIASCPKLKSLPHTTKEMENLECLSIRECPELERRCEKEKGEDWHIIAHIPYIRIGD